MRFGREVHDDIVLFNDSVHEFTVPDVSVHKVHPVGNGSEILEISRVGQEVQDGDPPLGTVAHHKVREVGANEAGTSSDQHSHNSTIALARDEGQCAVV